MQNDPAPPKGKLSEEAQEKIEDELEDLKTDKAEAASSLIHNAKIKGELKLAFIFGCVALAVIIVTMWLVLSYGKTFDKDTLATFLDMLQFILAMALAGVASAIPGFLEIFVRHTIPQNFRMILRAGGPIAVFVLIVFVAKPSDRLLKTVEYNNLLQRTMIALSWERAAPTNVPGGDALTLCNTLITMDKRKWQGYFWRGRYYFFVRNYEKMEEDIVRAAVVYSGGDPSTSNVPALGYLTSVISMSIYDFEGMDILRNLGLSEMGLYRHSSLSDRLPITERILERLATERQKFAEFSNISLLDLKWDTEIFKTVIWMRETGDKFTADYKTRVDAWTSFIDNDMGEYPKTWAYYHRALVNAVFFKRTGATDQAEVVRADVEAAITDITNGHSDNQPAETAALMFALFSKGNTFEPRSFDPILSDELKGFTLKDEARASHWIRRLRGGFDS
jgi:hypothetical protein